MAHMSPGYAAFWDRYMRRIRKEPASKQVLERTPTTERLHQLRMMTEAAWRRTTEYRDMRKLVGIWNGYDIHREPERFKGMHLHHVTYKRARGLEWYGDFEVCRGALHMHRHGRAA